MRTVRTAAVTVLLTAALLGGGAATAFAAPEESVATFEGLQLPDRHPARVRHRRRRDLHVPRDHRLGPAARRRRPGRRVVPAVVRRVGTADGLLHHVRGPERGGRAVQRRRACPGLRHRRAATTACRPTGDGRPLVRPRRWSRPRRSSRRTRWSRRRRTVPPETVVPPRPSRRRGADRGSTSRPGNRGARG